VIEMHERPIDDPMQRRPDLTLARERLGFRHTVPLREGLARTIAYFSSVAKAGARADLEAKESP
jgi:UDP-glucuronate decarboxylase